MNILGLSCGFHDSAAALVVDGNIAAAVEQERLTRIKHDPSFPDRAADTVLRIAGLAAADIDLVVFHEKPLGVVSRHLATRLKAGPAGFGSLLTETPMVIRDHLSIPRRIHGWFSQHRTRTPAVHYVEHHSSHAAAAFYPSPFHAASVLTVDGVGEWATSTIGDGQGQRLQVERELRFPDSVGLLYSAFTSYCGFRVNSGEGELMGLAPFGQPRFEERILETLVDLRPDGSIRLDPRYFAYVRGRRMTTRRFHALFDGPPRPLGSRPNQREADLAASIQAVTERVLLALAAEAHRRTGRDQLCLAGGVALNCVGNGRVLRDGPFADVWVQPAAGDAGSAVGAALFAWHDTLDQPRDVSPTDSMSGSLLGPSFDPHEIEAWLRVEGIEYTRRSDDGERWAHVAGRIADGLIVGWFCGRMEFGPRALGHRSILADPRSATVQGRINALVKERAAFRPFAPAVLRDRVSEWFEHSSDAPYMTLAVPVERERWIEPDDDADAGDFDAVVAQTRSTIPAVTHVDRTARVQTVDSGRNPQYTGLLKAFDDLTGCPVLLNTSFNARDEPVVCTPDDAYRTFRRTGLDLLVLEHCIIERS